ncbi:MAG TPA: alpha/beta hydrolase [Stellaceae bacterium]
MSDFIVAGGHRLEFKTIPGTRAGLPTLVFLHEGLGSISLWRDFPDRLAAATGAPALVYSRHGHGKSDRLIGNRDVDYMHREALEALPELRRQLGLDEVVLVGHSDGASIALIHAGDGRWPVRGLILEAPHAFVEDITVASIAAAKRTFETSDMGRRLGRHHDDPDATFWGWNKIWLDPRFRAWNIEAVLPRIRCPVLAIQGADDEYGTLAQLDAIARQIGGAFERCVLAACGHAPHRDQGAATVATMTEWWHSHINK